MSRITKELADRIAVKLTEKLQKEIDEEKKEFQEKLYQYLISKVPKEVLKIFNSKTGSHFIKKSSTIRFSGNGFNYEQFNLNKDFPCEESYKTIVPDKELAVVALSYKNSHDKKNINRKQLMTEISNALYNLRTYKNIEKEFPEAAKFLPQQNCTSLMINIKPLRDKINDLQK